MVVVVVGLDLATDTCLLAYCTAHDRAEQVRSHDGDPATLAAAPAPPVHTKEMKVAISARGKQGQRKEKRFFTQEVTHPHGQ